MSKSGVGFRVLSYGWCAASAGAGAGAQAVFEIRVLLADYLGSGNTGDLPVRQAAHLAYALHSQALAVLEGRDFNVAEAISGLG